MSDDCQEQLDFKDMKLQMLLVSLKELTATKEVIQTLEQLLCEESAQLQEERRQVAAPSEMPLGLFMEGESLFVGVFDQVTHSRDTYQDLVRLMEQHRSERVIQLSILRCRLLPRRRRKQRRN